ncbi:MAG: urease subunit alpha [Candidatus Nanopelagicales bacterium]|nr:urease subunit alpha [Candidatus Nanopelagicales bacterium]
MSRGPQSDLAVHGPRLGDRVRLGDTGLTLEVTADDRLPGDELLLGFAKTGRDGIGLQAVRTDESCDVVITNVLLVDAVLGVRVTSIGIRAGRIVALGRSGNPDTTDGIEVVVGSGTIVVPGEGLIATAGGIDPHVHGLSPRVMEAALASGVTSVIVQEFGPFWGVGVGSGWALRRAYAAFDAWPINVGVLGRGAASRPGPLLEALEAGVCGFKVHEDTGAHRRTLDTALTVAEEHDVAVCLHTDGLNEGLTVEDTLAVLEGRAVHAFHVEGCGGGHTPDVLRLAGVDHVLASSTNPTLPFGVNALAEHVSMIMVSHGLHAELPGDVELARARVRAATMGAENLLHDHGVIPMTSSDALGMGRAGETWRRTFALAAVTKGADGGHADAEDDAAGHDNDRVLRYLAKLTVNPAIVHGVAHEVGSLQVGRMADIVLWRPASFAAKPALVLKSGLPAWGPLGDPNATIDSVEPLRLGPQFGGHGAAPAQLSVLFTNAAADESTPFPTARRRVPVRGTRSVRLSQLVRNATLADVRVDPRSTEVTMDGRPLRFGPVDRVPLQRLYFL